MPHPAAVLPRPRAHLGLGAACSARWWAGAGLGSGGLETKVGLLPGRVTRRGAWQRRGPDAEVIEDLADDGGVLDRGDDPHPSLARGAAEHVEPPCPLHEHGPRDIP